MSGMALASNGYTSSFADSTWQIAGTGDFNADGLSDILWRNTVNSKTYIWFMNGTTLASSGYTGLFAVATWVIK